MRKASAKTWVLRTGAVLAALWAAYLVPANLLIATDLLESLISDRSARTQLSWDSAWTLIPGQVHFKRWRLEGQSPRMQYAVEVQSGRLKVGLLDLLRRRATFSDVEGEGVLYHQRRQRIPGEPPRPLQEFEPPLPGLPALRPGDATFELRPLRRAPWTISIDSFHAATVDQLWIDQYRIEGEGEARGAFSMAIRGPVQVSDAWANLRNQRVFVGQQEAGEKIQAQVRLDLSPVIARENPGLALLAFLSGRIEIEGIASDPGIINAYFSELPGTVLSGEGRFDLLLGLDKGVVTSASRFSYESEDLSFHLQDLVFRGRGAISAEMEGSTTRLRTQLDRLQLEIGGHTTPLAGSGLSVHAAATLTDLARGPRDLLLTIDLPETRIEELADLERGLPATLPVTVLVGSQARIQAHFQMSKNHASGNLSVVCEALGLSMGETAVRGDLILKGALGSGSVPASGLVFPSVVIEIANVEEEGVDDPFFKQWWAEVSLEDARVELKYPVEIEGSVRVRLRDALPLIQAFVPAGSGRQLAALFGGEDLEASARLDLTSLRFGLDDVRVEGHGIGRGLLGKRGFDLAVRSATLDPLEGFEDLQLDLELPASELSGFEHFNKYLPREGGVRFLPSGKGMVEGQFHLEEERLSGIARLRSWNTGIELLGVQARSDLDLHVVVDGAWIFGDRLDLSGSRLRLENLELANVDISRTEGWWAELDLIEGHAAFTAPFSAEARLMARMRDSIPLIDALMPDKPGLLHIGRLLSVENVNAEGMLTFDESGLQGKELTLEGIGYAREIFEGPGFAIKASAGRTNFSEEIEDLQVSLDLPPSRLLELSRYNEFIPVGVGLFIHSGESAKIQAKLRIEDDRVSGEALLEVEQAHVDIGCVEMRGAVDLEIQIADGSLESQRFSIGGSRLEIDRAKLLSATGPEEKEWSATVRVKAGQLELAKPVALEAELSLSLSDTRPLTDFLAGGAAHPAVANLLEFHDVQGETILILGEKRLRISSLNLSGHSDPETSPFPFEVRIDAHETEIDLNGDLRSLNVDVDLPRSELTDLSRLNRYLPKSGAISFLPGSSGWVEGELHVGDGTAHGSFELAGQRVRARLLETSLVTDLHLRATVEDHDLAGDSLALDDLDLLFEGLSIAGDSQTREPWWGRLRLREGEVLLGSPVRASALVELELKNNRLIVDRFAQESWLGRRLRRWLYSDGIEGQMEIVLESGQYLFKDVRFEGEHVEVLSEMLLKDGERFGALFAKNRWLPIAIGYEGDRRKIKLFWPRRWYDKSLSSSGQEK